MKAGRIADRLKQEYANAGMLTVNDAAQRLRVSPRTVRRHVDAGTLTVIRIGGRLIIPSVAIDRFLAAQMRIGSVA